jgi:signal transduction histidine kinase
VKTTNESYPHLISLAVHEVRGPASVVSGYLRMLQRDDHEPLTPRQRKMIDEAANSCARLAAIVEELSEVGKLDDGRVRLARQPLDVFELVDEVAALVHDGREREVTLEVRGLANGATISGDAKRLRHAFEGVFRAVVREKPANTIVVAERRIEQIDGRATAVVIVAEDLSVQAAYDREPGPFDEDRGGVGLALPLARRVIRGHGGRLWAPLPIGKPAEPGRTSQDPLTRGSAIICLPITELSR